MVLGGWSLQDEDHGYNGPQGRYAGVCPKDAAGAIQVPGLVTKEYPKAGRSQTTLQAFGLAGE